MVAQNETCDYTESIFLSETLTEHVTGCYVFSSSTGSVISSSEEIISHPINVLSLDICGATGGLRQVQSSKYIELLPGFNADIFSGGVELKIDDCIICIPGSSCDDNDICTVNDAYDSNCNCVGVFSDADGDGICTAEDCDDTDATIGGLGSSCDDGDVCTVNDVYDSDCNCDGIFSDADGDGICTAEDCDDTDASIGGEGSSCDDGDICTVNDAYDSDCNCVGTFSDADSDGVCTAEDCDDTDASIAGQYSTCDDGDECTINDKYDSLCNCLGTFKDSDSDGICNAQDPCPFGKDHGIENYTTLTQTFNVPIIDEISGLTFNPDWEEFLIVSDDGGWARGGYNTWSNGTFDDYGNNHCSDSEFSDIEAVTYLYESEDGTTYKYAIADERNMSMLFVDIAYNNQTVISHPDSYLKFSGLPCRGNNGIEGMSYDTRSNVMYFATEHSDQIIYYFTVPDVINGQTIPVQTLVDLSQVPGLSTYSTHGLTTIDNHDGGGPAAGNVLALVTKPGTGDNGLFERMIVEFDCEGNLLGQLDLEPTIPNSAELEGIVWVRYHQSIWVIGELGVMYELINNGSNLTEPISKSLNSKLPSRQDELVPSNGAINASAVTTVYPNPFIDHAKVEIDLVSKERVRIDVIDIQGKLVNTVADQNDLNKGHHIFDLESDDLESGLYFIRVQIGDFIETKKITKL